MPSKSYEFIIGSRALDQYRDYLLKRLDLNGYQKRSTIGRIMIDGGAVSDGFHSTIPRGVDFAPRRAELICIANAIIELAAHNKKQWVAVLIDRLFVPKNGQFSIYKKAELIGVKPKNFNKLVSRGVTFIGSRIILVDSCHKNAYNQLTL